MGSQRHVHLLIPRPDEMGTLKLSNYYEELLTNNREGKHLFLYHPNAFDEHSADLTPGSVFIEYPVATRVSEGKSVGNLLRHRWNSRSDRAGICLKAYIPQSRRNIHGVHMYLNFPGTISKNKKKILSLMHTFPLSFPGPPDQQQELFVLGFGLRESMNIQQWNDTPRSLFKQLYLQAYLSSPHADKEAWSYLMGRKLTDTINGFAAMNMGSFDLNAGAYEHINFFRK